MNEHTRRVLTLSVNWIKFAFLKRIYLETLSLQPIGRLQVQHDNPIDTSLSGPDRELVRWTSHGALATNSLGRETEATRSGT